MYEKEAIEDRKCQIRDILDSNLDLNDKTELLEIFVRVQMNLQAVEDAEKNLLSFRTWFKVPV